MKIKRPKLISSDLLNRHSLFSVLRRNISEISVADAMIHDIMRTAPICILYDSNLDKIRKLLVNIADTGKPAAAKVINEYDVDNRLARHKKPEDMLLFDCSWR